MGVVGMDGGWVANWLGCVVEGKGGSGDRKAEKRMITMKYNKNSHLPYCGECLSLWRTPISKFWIVCSVAGILAERKNIPRTWLFKGGVFESSVKWCYSWLVECGHVVWYIQWSWRKNVDKLVYPLLVAQTMWFRMLDFCSARDEWVEHDIEDHKVCNRSNI